MLDSGRARAWLTSVLLGGTRQHFQFVRSAGLSIVVWGDLLEWRLLLFDGAGNPVHNGPSMPFTRRVNRSRLRGDPAQERPILTNQLTCVHERYRHFGLGRFLQRVDELFAFEFGLAEVHLNAGCEALSSDYWQSKQGFLPSVRFRSRLEEDYEIWLSENGHPPEPLAIRWNEMRSDFVTGCVRPNYGRDGGTMELFKPIL